MLYFALIAAAAMGASDGKTMAHDDWHALSVLEAGGTQPGSSPYYLRVAAGDLDGDGRADDAFLKLTCVDGVVKTARLRAIAGPRDAGSGMPTGKRQHGSVTIVKEWGPATPMLRAMKASYDVKKMEGARADGDGWRPASLAGADGLCAAADAAAATIVKSKSNIPNN